MATFQSDKKNSAYENLVALSAYVSNQWLTYRQAASVGAHVRKGEHGVPVVFYAFKDQEQGAKDEAQTEPVSGRRIPMVQTYTVFNVAQIEGVTVDAPTLAEPDPIPQAEALLARSGAKIEHGGDRAYYRPTTDSIQLPLPGAFDGPESYYTTALHELVHWTGHPERCAREFGKRFGDAAYAAEELVAELGSAFLSAHCRLDGQLQHAEYLGAWLKIMKQDARAIFMAATQAQKATDYLIGRVEEEAIPNVA